jgi:hypothetical protein
MVTVSLAVGRSVTGNVVKTNETKMPVIVSPVTGIAEESVRVIVSTVLDTKAVVVMDRIGVTDPKKLVEKVVKILPPTVANSVSVGLKIVEISVEVARIESGVPNELSCVSM